MARTKQKSRKTTGEHKAPKHILEKKAARMTAYQEKTRQRRKQKPGVSVSKSEKILLQNESRLVRRLRRELIGID